MNLSENLVNMTSLLSPQEKNCDSTDAKSQTKPSSPIIPICTIAYSDAYLSCTTLMDECIRTRLARRNEDDDDALLEMARKGYEITASVISHNLGHYSAWSYRRECIYDMIRLGNGEPLGERDLISLSRRYIGLERDFIRSNGGSNPKNYQLWAHRRSLLEEIYGETLGHGADGATVEETGWDRTYNYEEEMSYVENVLVGEDAKNYHAWAHRQWVVRRYMVADEMQKYTKKELDFSEKMIRLDCRNNSAWNQRWFTYRFCQMEMSKSDDCVEVIDDNIVSFLRSEADFSFTIITLDAYNESPWLYVTEIVLEHVRLLTHHKIQNNLRSSLIDDIVNRIDILEEVDYLSRDNSSENQSVASIHKLTAKIELLEAKGDTSSIRKAIQITENLASKHDRIRSKYWYHRYNQLKDRIEETEVVS